MPPKKILLLRRLPEATHLSVVDFGMNGFSWIAFACATEVARAVQQTEVDLLLFDYRGLSGDPMAFIEAVRDSGKRTPVFLLSEPLAMVSRINAVRLGVKDCFTGLEDAAIMAERLFFTLQLEASDPEEMLRNWSEFYAFLMGDGRSDNSTAINSASALLPLPVPLKKIAPLVEPAGGEAALRPAELAERSGSATAEIDQELVNQRKMAAERNQQLIAAQEKLEEELTLAVQIRVTLEKERATWQAEKAATDFEQARRERAVVRLEAEQKQLKEEQNKLNHAREKLDAEQKLLIQAAVKQEKTRIDQETKLAQRDANLTQRAQEISVREKAQVEAEKQFLVQREKMQSTQALVARLQQALDQAQAQLNKGQATAQGNLSGRETLLAKKEKELTEIKAALQHEQEKFETEQTLWQQATAPISAERGGQFKIGESQRKPVLVQG